jgi:hypothetical protein
MTLLSQSVHSTEASCLRSRTNVVLFVLQVISGGVTKSEDAKERPRKLRMVKR